MNRRQSIACRAWLAAVLLALGVLASLAIAAAPAPDAPPGVTPDQPPAAATRLRPDTPPPSAASPRSSVGSGSSTPRLSPRRSTVTRRATPPATPAPPRVKEPAPLAGGALFLQLAGRERQRLVAGQLLRERAATALVGDDGTKNAVLSVALIVAGALAVLAVIVFGGRGLYRDREPAVDTDLIGVGPAPDQVPTLLP